MNNNLMQIETKKKPKDLSAGSGTTFHDLNN